MPLRFSMIKKQMNYFFDIEATKRGYINLNLIKEIAGETFMPFAYGGGVKTLAQISSNKSWC